jgi:hypothetical protein
VAAGRVLEGDAVDGARAIDAHARCCLNRTQTQSIWKATPNTRGSSHHPNEVIKGAFPGFL